MFQFVFKIAHPHIKVCLYFIIYYIILHFNIKCKSMFLKMLNGKPSITYHLAIMDYYNHNMILQ